MMLVLVCVGPLLSQPAPRTWVKDKTRPTVSALAVSVHLLVVGLVLSFERVVVLFAGAVDRCW